MSFNYTKSPYKSIVTVHSPRPLAGEGLGVRIVDSTTYPLTLTLSPLAGGEGTERLRLDPVPGVLRTRTLY